MQSAHSKSFMMFPAMISQKSSADVLHTVVRYKDFDEKRRYNRYTTMGKLVFYGFLLIFAFTTLFNVTDVWNSGNGTFCSFAWAEETQNDEEISDLELEEIVIDEADLQTDSNLSDSEKNSSSDKKTSGTESQVEKELEDLTKKEEAGKTELPKKKGNAKSSNENTSHSPKKSGVNEKIEPLEMLLPKNSAIIVKISSVRDINERLETVTETNFLKLLKSLGKGDFARQIHPDSCVGVVLFPHKNTFQWSAMIPTKNYKKFITLMGVSDENLPESIPDGTISKVSATLFVAPYLGYTLVGPSPDVLIQILQAPKFGISEKYTPCSVRNSNISIEFTNTFIRFLVQRGKIGMEEFAPVFTPEMLQIQEGSEQMELAHKIFAQISKSVDWIGENIQSARMDFTVEKECTVLSTSFLPRPGTRLAELIQDSYVPIIATKMNGETFLKVVPSWPAALRGQADIPPTSAERLEAPFNRIRHAEYSFMTPPENGRLAEAWCFFLEVDDSQAFVKELLVPRAEEVGGEYGANTLGEIGGSIALRMAERRQAIQNSRRRPPRIPANPENAAARGQALGSLVGGLLGSSFARKEAMKIYDFFGYDLYISDLIQYTQLKKRIREQEAGIAPPTGLEGMRPGEFAATLLKSIVSGDGNIQLQEMLMGDLKNENPQDPPLAATRNFILVLDSHHVLVTPGNDIVLYDALSRWKAIHDLYLPPEPPVTVEFIEKRKKLLQFQPSFNTEPPHSPSEESADWYTEWSTICMVVQAPQNHQLRLASIFTPAEALRTAEFASKVYGFQIPESVKENFPEDLPPFLSIYTTTPTTGNTFTVIPHEVTRGQFEKLLTLLPGLLAK